MSNSSSPPPTSSGLSLDGIEVVELSEVDLEFEKLFGKKAAPALEVDLKRTHTAPATADDLRVVEFFRGVDSRDIDALVPRCQSIHTVPGYVLLAPGRINSRIFFVIDGQLRVYAKAGDKRPIAIADIGHSTGLRSALVMQPINHAVIATEVSHVLAIDYPVLEEYVKRSHVVARNYAALLESYLRGDNCLHVGSLASGAVTRQSHIDELTLLHNQYWLDTIYPRLVTRFRLSNKPLAVVGFAVDKLDEIIKANGVGPGLRVLEAIGYWLLDQTRPTDLLAINESRYIYVFLPDCDLAAARQLADRLKVQARALPITLAPGEPPLTVTLSLGIAQFETPMRDKEFLVQIDAHIHASLKAGGDRITDI